MHYTPAWQIEQASSSKTRSMQVWPSMQALAAWAPVTGSRVVLTYASSVARMGVLQGLAASANVRPAGRGVSGALRSRALVERRAGLQHRVLAKTESRA